MKKFSIITPCYNAENHIKETIVSVLSQTALKKNLVQLEYIIVDGGSQDKTVSIIEKTVKEINHPNIEVIIISEVDQGMYDALSKGMKKITGDYCAYINAGDIYALQAFEIVNEIFDHERIMWLTSAKVQYNEKSQITCLRTPIKYRRYFIRRGIYGYILPYIQQESTFWKTELNSILDFHRLSQFELAGDYFLWYNFAAKASLYIVETYLGGFKIHKGQKSENHANYNSEIKKFIHRRWITAFLFLPVIFCDLIYYLPDMLKNKINRKTLIAFNHHSNKWSIS